MEGIYDANDTFNFEKLVLTKPTVITGGNYFIKLLVNDNPLYIQPPKCKLKQGISKAGKRLFADIMFTNENDQFVRWMENLENHCQKNIFNNREKWFDGELEMTDIENYFTPPLKVYKSGKFYIIRTNINTILGKSVLKIYDESENEVDMDNINENMNIMTILEIQGIKCSARSFQIEIELKQMLVMNPINIFDKCLLTKKQQDVVNYSHQYNNTETITPLHITNAHSVSSLPFETYPQDGVSNVQKCNETVSDTILLGKNNDEFQTEEIVAATEPNDTVTLSIKKNETNSHFSNGQVADKNNFDDDNRAKILSGRCNVSDNLETEPEQQFPEPENKEPIIEIPEKYLEKNENEEKFNMNTLEINKYSNGLEEVEFQLDELPENEIIQIKKRNEVYYTMYREARRKAKIARNLALSSYLEAKRIKNTYMLDDMKDSDDSDLDIDLENEDSINNDL